VGNFYEDLKMNTTTECVITPLSHRRCVASLPKATTVEISEWLKLLPDWKIETGELLRNFDFKNYYQTMAFVNALAWISHGEDHHPDLLVKYNACVVRYSTHSVGGLSENDFICAAKADGLI
jgi:4a-hydroxytetrahydrobiopterin dehydratase